MSNSLPSLERVIAVLVTVASGTVFASFAGTLPTGADSGQTPAPSDSSGIHGACDVQKADWRPTKPHVDRSCDTTQSRVTQTSLQTDVPRSIEVATHNVTQVEAATDTPFDMTALSTDDVATPPFSDTTVEAADAKGCSHTCPHCGQHIPCHECDDDDCPNAWQDESPADVATNLIGLSESSCSWVLGGNDRIGFFSLEYGPSMALEFDGPNSFETNTGSGIHFLDGPGLTDLPPRLFDLYLNVHLLHRFQPDFGYDVNFNVGIYTDFEDSAREGVRFPGRALLFYDLSRKTQILAGVEYLDRDTLQILPAGGLLLRPDNDTRLELYFPQPRLKIRVQQTEKHDKWAYLAGEYHGGSWAIERVTGNADVVTYDEFRFVFGIEWQSHDDDNNDNLSFLELGYLFDRELEYRSHVGDYEPDDTLMIRFGYRF